MTVALDADRLRHIFHTRPDILAGIQQAADSPQRISLFNEIASFVSDRLPSSSDTSDEPSAKRRRVEVANGHASSSSTQQQPLNGAPAGTVAQVDGADEAAAEPVLLEIKDISLTVPQRKKYDLVFTTSYLYARAAGSAVPVQGIVYAWRDIEHIFHLPVPEKSAMQYNYVLFPRGSYLPSPKTSNASSPDLEPLVFTVPATAPKPNSVLGPQAASAAAVSDTYTSLFNWALSSFLRSASNPASIISANPSIFHSAARQAYRPAEKAVHVKAFRGSKDGYLFFLPRGILWGFKKPLLFLPLDRVVAVSYTSVLQRTFNIVVEVDVVNPDGKTEEIEFAMLDQEDYQGINEMYIQRHGLQDRSMADARKAKRQLAENAKKGKTDGVERGEAEDAAGVEGEDGLTELERAHREAEMQLQDEEDEEEEDYDPGSDGESEGSGSSSEEDDGDGDGGEEEEEEEDDGDE
ncbi:putative chaperone protein [Coniochaeta sp. 2T2.1]|nr:putative chaperone protein [Coniochaeta sp. 2T2.1]